MKHINNTNSAEADYSHVRTELNKISSSFCLAKWNQVTLHLHQGVTHSCHHNPAHSIPKNEILDKPYVLHNTPEKIKHRKQMLNGDRPKDCNYCWRVEDSGNPFSDRILKSSYEESWPYANEVLASGLGEKFWPRYLEVSFSNTCQFKCSYCSANFSSKWQAEIEEHGQYLFGKNNLKFPILSEENNEYIEAFWKWWPEIRQHLRVFRITGGEPLLSKNTFRILHDLENNPRPDLDLAINTNLGVTGKPIDDLISSIQKLTDNNCVRQFTVYTSLDSFGLQAEYIRHGLNLKVFTKNVERLLSQCPKLKISFMVTFSALSPFKFQDFLDYYENLKRTYLNDQRYFRIGLDINYLRDPIQLSLPVLGGKAAKLCEDIVKRIENNPQNQPGQRIDLGYSYHEIEKAKHLLYQSKFKWSYLNRKMMQKRFLVFFKQHDSRRGTDLFKTFPELKKIF